MKRRIHIGVWPEEAVSYESVVSTFGDNEARGSIHERLRDALMYGHLRSASRPLRRFERSGLSSVPSTAPLGAGLERVFGRLETLRLSKAASTEVQVGEREVDAEPMRVFFNPAIPDFGEAEDALEDVEDVLDPRADTRLGSIDFPFMLADAFGARRTSLREVGCVRSFHPNHLSLATVGGIAPDPSLAAVQQVG